MRCRVPAAGQTILWRVEYRRRSSTFEEFYLLNYFSPIWFASQRPRRIRCSCELMRLSAFIQANSERIIKEWEEFAKTFGAGGGLPRLMLRDHAPAIVKFIVEDMETPQRAAEEIAKAKGEGPIGPIEHAAAIHVGLRIESGFDLVQIIAEYRALRSCVLRLWRTDDPKSFAGGAAEIVRFAEAVDQNIGEAIPYYQEREIQYRDQFLGILGHDLRNPISVISLAASLLADDGLNEEQQQQMVARIQRSTLRLDRMVTDILDFARGRLGSPMPLTLFPANLAALVREVVDEVRSTHSGLEIQYDDTNSDLSGQWDSERVKQMASNLLMNAVQHGTGNKVIVTTNGDQDFVLLEVHNEGPPIAKEMIETIFDPLVRVENPDRNMTGLGLGLFIVKEIVSAHSGTISVNSTQDAGTTFSVRLPRRVS
jgi:signal transduction histidine kinase